jgi:hypothetical protein
LSSKYRNLSKALARAGIAVALLAILRADSAGSDRRA